MKFLLITILLITAGCTYVNVYTDDVSVNAEIIMEWGEK